MSGSNRPTARGTLVDMARASEQLASRLVAGEATREDLDALLDWRQRVIDALPRPSQARLSPAERDAVRRIGEVDDLLWTWCRKHQDELRAQIHGNRARRQSSDRPRPARILSQEA